jgi:maltose 6'-phosphate phosphatase
VLTLNLHCYQEENQQEKFSTIAKAINDLDVDLVCLQEVAEPWNGGQGDWNANSARIIRDQLRVPYDLHVDWSHFGFGRYREGCAILSKYELIQRDACFVSSERGMNSIHSRKIVTGQVHVPDFGVINVFSAHLSWWANGFHEQFTNLHAWVDQRMSEGVVAALVCGDFNLSRGSEGYRLVTAWHGYADAYLEARTRRRDHDPGEYNDLRIDFAFVKKGGPLIAVATRELFNGQDYSRVSDHTGYYFEFESR